MIIVLYGPDTYRSRQKLNEIIEHYQKIHKSGLNLKYFSGLELNLQNVKGETKQVAIFKEKKLFVLVDVFSNSEFKEKFSKDVKSNQKFWLSEENIFLFYEKSDIAKKDPLFLFLEKNAKLQEFNLLEGPRLKTWAKKEFLRFKTDIGEEALDRLIDFVGNNLWRFTNEIQKLVSFRNGAVIRENDVKLLVKPKIEPDIFETIDAIATRNKKRAIQLLNNHLEKGDSPFYLFLMITFQFRNILVIKDLVEKNLSPYSFTNFHPYVVKKGISLAKKFSISELKKIYRKIFQVDLDIKTGRVEPEMALDLLITEI